MSVSDASHPDVRGPHPVRTVLLNNLAALLLGSAVMVLVHEAVHWLTGAALGNVSTLYSFGVTHIPEPPPVDAAIAAIAAPLFSLVSGLVLTFWQPLRSRGGFGQLLWLWFAFTSTQEGVTYFAIAPFGAGDTAETARLLHWPGWTTIVMCLVGIAGMFGNARLFATVVRRCTGGKIATMRAMAWWPWPLSLPFAVGSALLYTSLAKLSLTTGEFIVILLAGLSTTVFAPMSFIFARRVQAAHEDLRLRPVPVAGIIGYVAMVLVNVALTRGIRIG